MGTAIVSKGTMRVAMMTVSTSLRPDHSMRDSANPAIELTTRPNPTISTVTSTELNRKRMNGTRSKTPA